MKNIIVAFLLISSQLFAFDQSDLKLVQVTDSNNELVAGAKVELVGTGKVYYTNSKGVCYLPAVYLNKCSSVQINCISYKSVEYKNFEVNSKVVLEFR